MARLQATQAPVLTPFHIEVRATALQSHGAMASRILSKGCDLRCHTPALSFLAENPELLEADPALAAACRARGIRPGPVGSV